MGWDGVGGSGYLVLPRRGRDEIGILANVLFKPLAIRGETEEVGALRDPLDGSACGRKRRLGSAANGLALPVLVCVDTHPLERCHQPTPPRCKKPHPAPIDSEQGDAIWE